MPIGPESAEYNVRQYDAAREMWCPYCGAKSGIPCINRRTRKTMSTLHYSRYHAVKGR